MNETTIAPCEKCIVDETTMHGETINPDDTTQFKLVDDDTTPSKGKCYAPFFLNGKLVVKSVWLSVFCTNLHERRKNNENAPS